MKVVIEFECDNAAFSKEEGGFEAELNCVMDQAYQKVVNQAQRPEALCTHSEADDVLLDNNGNVIGTVRLVKDT